MDAIALSMFPELATMPIPSGEPPRPGGSLFGALVAAVANAEAKEAEGSTDETPDLGPAQVDGTAAMPPPVIVRQWLAQSRTEPSLPKGLISGLDRLQASEQDPAALEADAPLSTSESWPVAPAGPSSQPIPTASALGPTEPSPTDENVAGSLVATQEADTSAGRHDPVPPGGKVLDTTLDRTHLLIRHRDNIAHHLPEARLEHASGEAVEHAVRSRGIAHPLSAARLEHAPSEAIEPSVQPRGIALPQPATRLDRAPSETIEHALQPRGIAHPLPVARLEHAPIEAIERAVLSFMAPRAMFSDSGNDSTTSELTEAALGQFPTDTANPDHPVRLPGLAANVATSTRELADMRFAASNTAAARPSDPAEKVETPAHSVDDKPTPQTPTSQDALRTAAASPPSASLRTLEQPAPFAANTQSGASPPPSESILVSASLGTVSAPSTNLALVDGRADVPVKVAPATRDGQGFHIETLALHIAARSARGDSRFTIRLDPPELGRIEVNLSMTHQGHAQAVLAVEKPQTLDLLLRDAPALERALKDAGLELGSNLSFSLKEEGRPHFARDDHYAPRARTVELVPAEAANAHSVLNTSLHEQLYGLRAARLDITV